MMQGDDCIQRGSSVSTGAGGHEKLFTFLSYILCMLASQKLAVRLE
jgi:hypothetical protein